jgi:hypothetical protein
MRYLIQTEDQVVVFRGNGEKIPASDVIRESVFMSNYCMSSSLCYS